MEIDFKDLNNHLLRHIRIILTDIVPGGKLRGNEYVASSIRGGDGDSFSININTGIWADFASSERGGDIINLYSQIENISQIESAKQLAKRYNYTIIQEPPKKPEIIKPPKNIEHPHMIHRIYGEAVAKWTYTDHNGKPLFFVGRYESKGKKLFFPWSYDIAQEKFVCKGYPIPRPLYGLKYIKDHPDKSILIVEGEKCADAARSFLGHIYNVVTWSNGAQSALKSDWSPIYNKKVLVWPDADDPGREVANVIAKHLNSHCPEIKIINTDGMPDGWDCADSNFDYAKFVQWGKPRVSLYRHSIPKDAIPPIMVSTQHPDEPAVDPKKSIVVQNHDEPNLISGSLYSLYEQYNIQKNGSGNAIPNMDTVMCILECEPRFKDLVWYDTFHHKYFTLWGCTKPREWNATKPDNFNLCHILQRHYQITRMEDSTVKKAVIMYGSKVPRNEPQDWIKTLKWDTKPRIEKFFTDCLGVDDNPYTKAASRNFWISIVARIINPGCQVDNMVILKGAQGKFKSTALSLIGKQWYAEAHESATSKDFYMALHGKLIMEISELDAFNKAEITTIKKIITCRTDRFRPPYGEIAQDFPRQCIFVGTTNEDEFLRDPTGLRRFWPIEITNIDTKRIIDTRDQLFAEAAQLFNEGTPWHIMPDKETKYAQEKYRIVDDWEDVISDYIAMHSIEELYLPDFADSCLKIKIDKLDRMTQLRIAKNLRSIGFTKVVLRHAGKYKKMWVNQERFLYHTKRVKSHFPTEEDFD